ncbi:MAG TPA: tyrosine-type recombinase/integrase [Caulobacteraceae bacterium]|nr:tyrosine-type recombinase/integrase [Caulobacteraceae bacterium]
MPRLTDARVAAIPPPASGQEEHKDDLVTGLRLRVGAGGRKAWIVRTRAGGKPINKTLGTYPALRLADARDEARALLTEIAKRGALRTTPTFGEAAQHWIDNIAKARNSSWKNQQRRLEIHVLPLWRDRALASITRGDVRDLIDGIDGKVAPAQALSIIKTVMRYAAYRDWIDASPADAIPPPGVDVPRDRFLSMAEVARLYRAAELLGYPFGGWVRLLILTGQRRTEVASMAWADVDLDAATWVIPATQTKNGRAQLVPLSSQAVALLRQQPRLGPYVWSSDGVTFISGYSRAKSRLDDFIKNPELSAWRFHDIRRTVATHCVRLGVLAEVIERLLNHSPKGVTARVYALHNYAAEKREALQLWANEVDRVLLEAAAGCPKHG